MRLARFVPIAIAAALSAQAPTVVSTSPVRHAMMGPFDPIRVVFAAPIAPATVTAQSFAVFGRWTGVVPGTLTVDAAATTITFQPAVPMFVGDFIQVDLASTITSAQGAPLVGGFHFQATVRSSPSSGVFQQAMTLPFRLPSEGPIGTYGIHAGDVDRDGSPDVTAINEVSHDLRVFRNSGCGTFGPRTLIADQSNMPSPHESADFNRDGWMDLATGDFLFGNVSVFFNDGAGNYLAPMVLVGSNYIRSVAAGDLDGDGYSDLVAGNGSQTLVWINNHLGGFLPPVTYSFQGSAELNVVDVNEDGILDILGSALSPGQLWVLIGNGNGTFTPNATLVPIGGQPLQSAVADLNGDGHIDVAYCCNNPELLVWMFGNGLGGFTFGGSLPAGNYATSVHLADLDGDGDVDAVLSNYSSADFYIFMNNGSGGFLQPTILPAVGGASCTTLADFDRDGDIDIFGADEIADVGILYAQVSTPVAGLQPASCGAALRIDQRADGAGFGGTTPVPVHAGAAMAVSLSGPSGVTLGAVFLGYPAASSYLVPPWGLVSIDPAMPFVGIATALLDVHGEMLVPLSFPASAPIGSTLALQGLVLSSSGDIVSNPMQFTLVP